MQNDVQNDAAQVSSQRIKRLALLSLAIVCAVLAIFIIAFTFGASTRPQEPSMVYSQGKSGTDVLLVMSYDETEANTPLARNGVIDVMNSADVGVDVVYMDAYHAPIYSDAYNSWVSQVRQKVAQHGAYNAIICCDDEALYFAELNHDTLFKSTPVVFFGVNNIEHAMSAARSGYSTGMIEQSYMGSIMEATYNMHPEATSFTAIVDQTPAGVGNKAQFDSAVSEYDDMAVRYVNASNLTRNELAASVASANPDTIVFLLDANNDRYGNVYTLDESVSLTTTASKVPVYRATIGGVGDGIAGSAFLDPEQDGRKAALITIDVLNGAKPSSMPLVVDGTLGYMFDGEVLSNYGVSTVNMPIGSTVVNRQLLSFDTLRALVFPTILLLVALFLFLRSRRIAKPQLAAVSAGPVETSPEPEPELVEEEPTNIVEAVAVEEAPVKQIDPSARLTKKQQLAKDRKRRGTKRGHQRQLRKTHSITADAPHAKVEPAEESVVVEEADELLEVEALVEGQPTAELEPEILVEDEQAVEMEDDSSAEPQVEEVQEAQAPVTEAEEEPVAAETEAAEAVEVEEADEAEPEIAAEAEVETETEAETKAEAEVDAVEADGEAVAAEETEVDAEVVAAEETEDAKADEADSSADEAQESEANLRAIVGIKVIGLDEIKNTYGAHASEEALRVVRKRLEGVENSRLLHSEDECILLGFDTDIERNSQELELIEFMLREPITVDDNAITLNSCIGAVNIQKDMDCEELRTNVEFAINQAEELGYLNIVVFYDSNMRRAIQDRAKITELLQEAIDQESFIVYYQPQIGLDKNEVVGYEALARLKDKTYPPTQFIPIAEVTGLIVDIDRIVTKRAVEQLAIWKRRNKRVRPISINFSPVHLVRDDDFPSYLLELLETYEVSSDYIKIEVTETLFTGENQEKAEEMVKRLFDAGISIALDNFGVGYTSFADIMSIPASIIKIDKEFVDTFLIDGNSQNFEQLVRLAHGLGRKVVVVGVDKKWQIDVCRGLNCDIVQGYYFSKPLLPENAVQFRPRG